MTIDQAIARLQKARTRVSGETELCISYDGGHKQDVEMVAIVEEKGKITVRIGEFFSWLLHDDPCYVDDLGGSQ